MTKAKASGAADSGSAGAGAGGGSASGDSGHSGVFGADLALLADLALTLSPAELETLVGCAAVDRLHAAFDGQCDVIKLRRVTAERPHCDCDPAMCAAAAGAPAGEEATSQRQYAASNSKQAKAEGTSCGFVPFHTDYSRKAMQVCHSICLHCAGDQRRYHYSHRRRSPRYC